MTRFFFKLSAARRDDYVGVGVVTGIAVEFAKKFGATWWLCMKQVWILPICEKYAYDGNAFWYCFQYVFYKHTIQKLEFRLGYTYAKCEFMFSICLHYA